MGFLTQQTFIPWLFGNLPGDYLEESTIEMEEMKDIRQYIEMIKKKYDIEFRLDKEE